MHPLLKTLRSLSAYLLAWGLASLVPAAAWVQTVGAEWSWTLAFLWPVTLLTAMTALSMYPVCRSLPLRPARWATALAQRAAAALTLAVLMSGAAGLWNLTGIVFGREGLVLFLPLQWLVFFGLQTGVFVLSVLIHDALLAQQAIQAAAAAEAQARLQAREMELKALRHQVDPHFLFNSLNSISALTQLDPAAARAMTIDLADYFRQTLSLGGRERIPLAQELELVQRYLAIEQRRMGDRLRLCLDIEPACRAAWLPALLLQPLVENAVKHGIRYLDEGGTIELRARHVGDRLVLRIVNPVDAEAPRDTSGLGQGLRHLRTWLQTLYAEPTFVDVERAADHYTVQISLPWQP